MKVEKFIIKSDNYGRMILTYHNGILYSIINEFHREPSEKRWMNLMIAIPMLSININKLIDLNFKIENDTAHERIALFCKKYKQHISISYKVTKAETGKLRDLSIGIAELDILFEKYFQCNEWWAKNKGISNFVKHLNEVRILAAGITAGKYPNEWDLQFNNKLAPAAAQEYWKHLRSLGWNPVKRGGQVIKWEKK